MTGVLQRRERAADPDLGGEYEPACPYFVPGRSQDAQFNMRRSTSVRTNIY
jgi:hypothetical protein